jgi:methanethiol S-methyltransferase
MIAPAELHRHLWRNVMTGRAAALIYGLTSYLIFSLSFAYTPAFLGNFLVPKTIDT